MRLIDWILRRRRDDDLQAEIRAHLSMATQDRIDQGDDAQSARLAALKEFSAWYQPASDGRVTVLELRHPANANARRGAAPVMTASVAAHSA